MRISQILWTSVTQRNAMSGINEKNAKKPLWYGRILLPLHLKCKRWCLSSLLRKYQTFHKLCIMLHVFDENTMRIPCYLLQIHLLIYAIPLQRFFKSADSIRPSSIEKSL
jgi:hypothetical protein